MTGNLTNNALRNVLREVERDEAAAIDALCAVLERVEESRDFSCLPGVRKIVKEWQNRPPGGIVTDLMRIHETLKCQAHDNT
jgi:hypothetical protein